MDWALNGQENSVILVKLLSYIMNQAIEVINESCEYTITLVYYVYT